MQLPVQPLTARLALSRPRWISVLTEALVRPIQLPMFSASRRMSFAARPASFWKAVIGSAGRSGGFGGCADDGFRFGMMATVDDGVGVGRAGTVAGDGLERPISSMRCRAWSEASLAVAVRLTSSIGRWEGGGVVLALSVLLTSSIGGKAGERGLDRIISGLVPRGIAALATGRARELGTVALLVRDRGFLAESEWRRTTTGAVGSADFGADFALEGAFLGFNVAGCGAGTGAATSNGGVLTLFSTAVAVAFALLVPVDFVGVETGAERPTAGATVFCRVTAAVDGEGSGGGATGFAALGATVRAGASGVDSAPDSAVTSSLAGAVETGVSTALSAEGALGVGAVGCAAVSVAVVIEGPVEAPAIAVDSRSLSAVGVSGTPATVFSFSVGSAGDGESDCVGVVAIVGVEFAVVVDSGAGTSRASELSRGDGASAALGGSTGFRRNAG